MQIQRGRRGAVSLVMIALLGCGGSLHPQPGADGDPGWYELQFTSATIAPRRPDGAPWHQTAANPASLIVGGLVGLAIGSPGLGLSLGGALADPGGDPLAPIPYVVVKLAGKTYRISALQQSYAPTWQQPIAVDVRGLQASEPVVIQIMDAGDGGLITQHQLPLGALLARPSQTLTNLGSVASLDVTIKPLRPRAAIEYDLVVPSNLTLDNLLAHPTPGWREIPIWNGDTITLEATGSVCPSSISDDCFGPDGATAGRWSSYSYDGFKDLPHASLIGLLPDGPRAIGRARQLHAEQAGRLLLFVNDTDADNNRGTFHVHLRVDPAP